MEGLVSRKGSICRPFALVGVLCAFTATSLWGIYQEQQEYLNLPEASRPLESLLPKKGVESSPGYLKINSKHLHSLHDVNFDTREVEIIHYLKAGDGDSIPLWSAYYSELGTYSMDMNELALRKFWLDQFIGKGGAMEGGGGSILDLELPWEVPDWMKRFGVDKPRLKISGSYKLVLSGATERGPDTPSDKGWFPSLSLDQQPAFSVKGSIGRLINVEINSEEGFGTNFQEQLKITYKGEGDELEDDIIQEIEAGNTSLSLKGTALTGYTENHKGIFGLKMRMKFGDLEVTTIASQEGGSQERQQLGAGVEERTILIDDRNPSLYRHFFLNLKDRTAYLDPNNIAGTPEFRNETDQREVSVYVSVPVNADQENEADERTAYVLDREGKKTEIKHLARWKVLDKKDYVYDPNLRMLTVPTMTRSRSLAVRYSGEEADPFPFGDKNSLVLLYSPHLSNAELLDPLMLRNVYNIGRVSEKDRDLFRLDVVNMDSLDREGSQVSFRRRLGLETFDTTRTELALDNDLIFDFDQGLLILPCIVETEAGELDADGDGKIDNCLEPLKRINPQTRIYEIEPGEMHTLPTVHQFVLRTRQRKSTFSVSQSSHSVSGQGCIDITPNTEKLVLDGSTVLQKDVDYEVLYELGQITLLSTRAKDPNAQIEITYECTPIFQIQDKVLLGTRLEYSLDNISEESLLGLTVLYKSQSTTQERPELGREPFNQFLWGFNSRLAGNPRWMTQLVNRIPLVETEAESRVNFELEVAQSHYNPNTKDDAYLDDFESSKNSFTFPMNIDSWTQASPPGNTLGEPIYIDSLDYRHMGDFIWHSNLTEEYSRIYGRTGYSTTDSRTRGLLKLMLTPNDNLQGRSWGGIMRAMSSGLYNQTRKRFLEVVVRGREGKLYFDLGQISEDISIAGRAPNGRLDSEVEPGIATNNTDDPGLDRLKEPYETGIRWECKPNCYPIPFSPENQDPAGDNFDRDQRLPGLSQPDKRVNGTQGNNENNPQQYDTEDLDRTGALDTDNRYLRYSIELNQSEDQCLADPTCEVLQSGWRKYQIPLYEVDRDQIFDPSNTADVSDILTTLKMVRVWFGSLPERVSESSVLLERIALVGNNWEAAERNRDYEVDLDRFASGDLGDSNFVRVPPAVSDSNRLKVEVIDKREERDRYEQSPNIKQERDTRTDEPLPERSLVMNYENLHPGEVVHATRTLSGESRDLTLYDRILLDIHPDITAARTSGQNKVSLALQIGRDRGDLNSDNYYEIRVAMDSLPIPGIDTELTRDQAKPFHKDLWLAHSFSVRLEQLAALKVDPDSIYEKRRKSSTTFPHPRNAKPIELSVVGEPSLANINWMRLVVEVDSGATELQTGEIWLNDLRLEGVNRNWGTAMRTHLQLDFSDFITTSGNITYNHGDFTSMSQTKATPAQSNTRMDYNTNVQMNANKFLPDRWGVALPLSLTYNGSIERPFVKPNSDVILQGQNLSDIVGDLIDGQLSTPSTDSASDRESRLARVYQTTNFGHRFTTSYRKDRRSGNFFVRALFERPEMSYSYSDADRRSFYEKTDALKYNTRFSYDMSPHNNKGYKPLSFAERWKPMPDMVTGFEVTPLPNRLNFVIADFTFEKDLRQVFPRQTGQIAVLDSNWNVTLSHSADMEWRPFQFLGFSYRLSVNRDFDEQYREFQRDQLFSSDGEGFLAKELVFDLSPRSKSETGGDEEQLLAQRRYGILAQERNREQTFNMDFSPTLLTWLNTGMNFSSTYSHLQRDSTQSITRNEPSHYVANYGHDAKFTAGLRVSTLMTSLSKGTKSIGGLSSAFQSMQKGIDKMRLRTIDFSYGVSHRYNNEKFSQNFLAFQDGSRSRVLVRPRDFYAYQLGAFYEPTFNGFYNLVTMDPDKGQFDIGMYPYGAVQDQFVHVYTRNYSVSSGFSIPVIDLNISGSLKYNQSWAIPRSAAPGDTSTVWPEYSVSLNFGNFARRVGFLKNTLRTLTASSSYNYKEEELVGRFSATRERESVKHSLSPLLRLSATTNKDKRFENTINFSHETARSYGMEQVTDAAEFFTYTTLKAPAYIRSDVLLEKTLTLGDVFSFSYDVETKKGIQFWRYYVKLNNNLRLKLSLTGDWIYQTAQSDEEKEIVQENKVAAGIKPEVSYNFTSNVDALFYTEYAWSKIFVTEKQEENHKFTVHGEVTVRF